MGSEHSVFSIHTKPHIRKYLMVRWAPGDHLADPAMQAHLRTFSELLRRPIFHAELDAALTDRPRSELRLVVGQHWGQSIGHATHDRFNHRAEEQYRAHFHQWAQFAMNYTPRTVSQVVEDWYMRYGLKDEDLPLSSSKQSFLRHRKRVGLVMPRGGSRPGPRSGVYA